MSHDTVLTNQMTVFVGRWDDMKEQGGAKEAMTKKVEVVRSSFIRRVNAGEDYEHHYRRKSR